MLNLNYYSGSVNGANYQDAADVTKANTRTTVINLINKVCNTYSINEDILLGIMNAYPNEFIGYVLNNNNDVKTDKMVQNLIIESIEEAGCIYDEDTIDEILVALDISC